MIDLDVKNYDYVPGELAKMPRTRKRDDPVVNNGQFMELPLQLLKPMVEAFFRSLGVSWDEQNIRHGAFGVVFKMTRDQVALLLGSLTQSENEVMSGAKMPVPSVDDFAVKVQSLEDLDTEMEAIEEDTVHKTITDAKKNDDLGGISGRDIVPQFVFGSTLIVGQIRIRLTISEYIVGETLRDFLRSGDSDLDSLVRLYVHLERASLFLWSLGYSHADFHAGNIMVETATGEPKIIDFGYAVEMRPEKVSAILQDAKISIRDQRNATNALVLAFNKHYLQNMKNSVAVSKNVRPRNIRTKSFWFNPDSGIFKKLMAYLKTLAPSDKKLGDLLSKARLRAYGIQSRPLNNIY